MIDREEFASHLRDALAHLYDRPYLRVHPIGPLLLEGDRAGSGDELRRLLLDAIEELRPPGPCPPETPAWRRHGYLVLRYVEAVRPEQIARELRVSVRQSQREHERALDDLAGLLWDRHVEGRGARPTLERERPGDAHPQSGGLEVSTGGAPGGDASDIVKVGSLPPGEPTDLGEALTDALRIVARLAKLRGARIIRDLAPSLPPVRVQRLVLRQVLIDLLGCALESRPTGPVQVLAIDSADGIALRLAAPGRAGAIADQPPEVEARLAAIRTLLGLQGGSLAVEPVPGFALHVTLRLPVSRTRTLLVVDDNPDVAYMFARFLEDHRYRVLHASTGRVALQLARKVRPDAITLDVLMPSQDGWDTLRKLTADPVTQTLPVIICSVLPERSLALSLGVSGFLGKPVTRESLLEALQRCVPTPAPPG